MPLVTRGRGGPAISKNVSIWPREMSINLQQLHKNTFWEEHGLPCRWWILLFYHMYILATLCCHDDILAGLFCHGNTFIGLVFMLNYLNFEKTGRRYLIFQSTRSTFKYFKSKDFLVEKSPIRKYTQVSFHKGNQPVTHL